MKCFNRKIFLMTVVILFAFFASPVFAQRTITIRLASIVPENTAWGAAINRLAAEWTKATNNEVRVIVYHNSTAGDEAEVLRKLRINELQAGVFTSVGMSSITPEVMAISYPFLIRNNNELNVVMGKIKTDLDKRMQQNGFFTLAWAHAGWVKFFSKSPVYVPSDLRKLKLATGTEEEMLQAFRVMGYQMIPSEFSTLLTDLRSGKLDVVYQSPIYVAGGQVFGIAGNMTNVNIAPFMGGIVMNETAWRRIPDKYKPKLQEISRQIEKEIESSITNLEAEAINTMTKYGLKIIDLSPQQKQEWIDDIEKYENRLVGGNPPIFHREYYNRIKSILADYRK